MGRVLVTPWYSVASYCRAQSTGRDSVLSCCSVRSSDACQGAGGLRRWPATPSLSLSSTSLLPLPPVKLRLPLSPLCVSGEEEGRAWCRGVVDHAWSEEEVANRREGPHWGSFFVKGMEHPLVCVPTDVAAAVRVATSVEVSPRSGVTLSRAMGFHTVRWCSEVLAIRACLGWPTALLRVRACLSLAGLIMCYKPAVRHGFVVLPRLFARCLALEGLSQSEVVSVSWDPVLGSLLREYSGLRACSSWQPTPDSPLSHYLSLRWFRSHVVVLGMGPQLGQAAVLCALCVSVAALSHPSAGAEAGARLVSRACGLRVPLLAASGGGLVAIVVTTFSSRRFHVFLVARTCMMVIARLCLVSAGVIGLALGRPVLLVVPASVFSQFRGPVLGCQPMMALACVLSTASALCPTMLVSFLLLWPLGARRRRSSVSDGLRRRLWRRVVVSSSESECCELLYPSVRLPCMINARVAGCSCYCAMCVASVVARRVRAIAARLALDSMAVVFLVWRTLAGKSRCFVCGVASPVERCDPCLHLLSAWCWLVMNSSEVLLEFFSIGSGGRLFLTRFCYCRATSESEVRCWFDWCVLVVFPGTVPWWFWWGFSQDRLAFFPGSPFGAFGGGSSQECFVFVSGHRCVAPVVCVACRLVGLRYGLGWRVLPVSPWRCFGRWCTYVALCLVLVLVVALSVVRQALVVASVPVFPLALGAIVFGCGTLLRSVFALLSTCGVGGSSRSGCQGLEALVGYPFPLSLSSSSLLPLRPAKLRLPLSPLCVSGKEEGRAWRRGVMDLTWSEEEVANRREGPHWGSFFVKVTEGDIFVAVSWQRCQEGRDPHPREPVEGVLRATSVLELAAHVWDAEGFGVLSWRRPESPLSHCLSLRWFRSHVAVLGVGPQLGQAAVLCALCVSAAALSHPSAGVEAGARLASRACRLRVPLLASSSSGLVAVVVTAFSSRRFQVFLVARACTMVIARLCLFSASIIGLALGRPVLLVVPASVFSRFCGLVLGCQPMMAPACVASRPDDVRGPGWFCLWAIDLVELWARRRGSSVSDGLRRRLWRRVFVSSIESECCELLYLSELRVVFCKSSGNNPQKTTELFSFGRLKEEKTRSRLHPLREATTSTRPHHSLGTVNSVNQRVNVVNRQPLHRQREFGGVREHPRDPVTVRKRTVYSSLLAITVGQLLPLRSYCGPIDGKRSCHLSR
ncbi:hypothetical protein Taro_017025 [Colocasia esculenta]|uniref:Uncharacterized protein n=1 Tax=Colocasia esculenta TaxID=4460 RepID=A0A843US26_COLES|nr:hypothetical protein [Colocasia esculenta]